MQNEIIKKIETLLDYTQQKSFTNYSEYSADEVNQIMLHASNGTLRGVLGYNKMPLVSGDFNHCATASIFDATLTKVSNGNLVKVLAWYDNEWGFSCQMLNTARAMFGMPVSPL